MLVATVGALVTFIQKLSKDYSDFVNLVKRGQYPVKRMCLLNIMVFTEQTLNILIAHLLKGTGHDRGGGEPAAAVRGREVLAARVAVWR